MTREKINPATWSAQERELAISMRAESSNREIAKEVGKTPKAVERFFDRIGLTKEQAIENQLGKNSRFNSNNRKQTQNTNLTTTWGDPMIVRSLDLEFGHSTSVCPVAIIPDVHAGIEDMRCIELVCKIIEKARPVAVIYLGDLVDFGMLSSFLNPPERILKAQEEIDVFHKIDRMVASAAGKNTRRYAILGNHDDRVYKMLCGNPAIASLRNMQIDSLLALDSKWNKLPNFQLIEDEIVWRDRFVFKHGEKVSGMSAYSARKEMSSERCSGISGHVHRVGVYCETRRGKPFAWYEGGCVCSLDPPYMKTKPNWQHCMNIGYFSGDQKTDFFTMNQIVISNYQAIINGELLSVK